MPRSRRSRVLTATVLVAVIVGGVGAAVVSATPSPVVSLPAVSPDALVASALRAAEARTPVSGTVTTHIDLGIPQIPDSLAGSVGSFTDLLADQTIKVWSSPDGLRAAQILPFAERTLVASRSDVWLWDSQTSTAIHYGITASEQHALAKAPLPDPAQLAAKLIRTVRPFARVSIGTPVRVAGRDAYTLRLTPVSEATLVGHIDVSVDAATRVPLRVAVFPKGSDRSAMEAGFARVSFAPIDPAMFSFTPPPGATVKQAANPAAASSEPLFPDVRVFGKGFGIVVGVRAPSVPKSISALLPYSGPLGSAEVVDRGDHVWVVAGLAPPAILDAAAQKLP